MRLRQLLCATIASVALAAPPGERPRERPYPDFFGEEHQVNLLYHHYLWDILPLPIKIDGCIGLGRANLTVDAPLTRYDATVKGSYRRDGSVSIRVANHLDEFLVVGSFDGRQAFLTSKRLGGGEWENPLRSYSAEILAAERRSSSWYLRVRIRDEQKGKSQVCEVAMTDGCR